LQDLKNNLNNSNTHQTVTDNTHNLDSKALEDLKRDLKDKLDILNKKVSNLQSDSNQHDKDIAFLKESLEQFKSENNDSNGDKDN
jgi:chaperonin cofactor prefoldin